MQINKVRKFFEKYGKENEIKEFDDSTATVELAAQVLNVDEGMIAKSLAFALNDGNCALIVCSGDTKVDNSKFKTKFNIRPHMLSHEMTMEMTGHAVGGVCPFAIDNPNVKIYTDISLKRFDKVYPACGSSNSLIGLTIEELYNLSNSIEWVDVCKNWCNDDVAS